jgi:pimeloyl-ACP methyl ester carboxylesterase
MVAALAIAAPSGFAASPQLAPAFDRTSPREAHRVDRVPTPRFSWFDCSAAYGPGRQCTTTPLPLDYDEPNGPQTQVALLRIRASDRQHRIGTLFLNPGGPGGSGVEIAAAAPFFLGSELLARFDIVGFDPRGTNNSDNVRCWANFGDQGNALAGMNVAFPYTAAENAAYIASSKAFGRACSTTGRPLSGSMSTAEVARDMDVLRRGLGDTKLSYLGFSYGSYLGQVYANLFPDRVRTVAIDGVIDPLAWTGTPATSAIPQTTRLKSGEGSAKALHEILLRCGKAGPAYCAFSALGDPLRNYAKLIRSLKHAPIRITDPASDQSFTMSYADLVGILLGMLYDPSGSQAVDAFLTSVFTLLPAPAVTSPQATARQAAARATLLRSVRKQQENEAAAARQAASSRQAFGFSFPYFNGPDAFQSVLCTDGLNPPAAGRWPAYADAANKTAPDFGRLWTWVSAPCAANTWTIRDEDAYSGPFTHNTVNPVLVVGDFYDPATNYQGAVTAAALLPNSRLLSSNSWGHTAYGTSACVTDAVNNYLLRQTLPTKGILCVGDAQPFTTPLPPPGAAAPNTLTPGRPPVAPPTLVTPHW